MIHNFIIKEDNIKKAQKVLKDYNLSEKFLRNRLGYKYLCNVCYDDILNIINKSINNSEHNYPLFSGNNMYIQNIISANSMKYFIEEIEDDNFYDFDYRDEYLKNIRSGYYLIYIFKENFLYLDWKNYGFDDADQLYYVLGAYLANIIIDDNYRDHREINVMHKDSDNYKNRYSSYYNHIHGDFRIAQYDGSETTMYSPYDKKTIFPFAKLKLVSNILGYHSVEAVFLINLLAFIYQEKIDSVFIDRFDEFHEELLNKGQTFGSYADAGLHCSSTNKSILAGIHYNNLLGIPIENGGYYYAEIKDSTLIYNFNNLNKNTFIIYPEMVDDLIEGLFRKVNVGNGRSSTIELKECIDYFVEKYYKKDETIL